METKSQSDVVVRPNNIPCEGTFLEHRFAHMENWGDRYFASIPSRVLEMEYSDIKKVAAAKIGGFGDTHLLMKKRYWDKFYEYCATGKKFYLIDVYRGIGTPTSVNRILAHPEFCAWLLMEEPQLEERLDLLLDRATGRLEEILSLPLIDDKGRPNAKMAAVLLDAYNKIIGRLKGGEVQRIEQKKLDVKVNVESNDDEMRKKIDDLKKKLGYDQE